MNENMEVIVNEDEEETTDEMETKRSGSGLGTLFKIGLGIAIGAIGTKAYGKIKKKRQEAELRKIEIVEEENDVEEEDDSEEE